MDSQLGQPNLHLAACIRVYSWSPLLRPSFERCLLLSLLLSRPCDHASAETAATRMATPSAIQSTGLLNLEKELVCFICTEVLYQPLTLIDCLHTFCGSCLKEWFSHQYRKASHSHTPPSNPYTCPTCRATVKDAQHNAMINTLLEMFLAANPEKHRPAEEKAEMGQLYKSGDNILPKVEPRRRDRRRRDEEDARRERHAAAEEPRERSRREGGSSTQTRDRLAPQADERSRSRSRDHDDRRDRRIQERQQRREMRDRVEVAEARLRNEAQTGETVAGRSLSPPPSSPRHPDAVEARSRARTVAHQASIRSLVSVSEDSGTGSGTGDSLNEARLMSEILSEGLLDGINVDELTEAQQDELSEIIAERYRQLHPRGGQRPASGTEDGRSDVAVVSSAPQDTQLEEADRRQSSRSAARRANDSPRSRSSASGHHGEQRPPMSHSRASQNEQTLSPPSHGRNHHRRASDQSGRDRPVRVHRSSHPGPVTSPATRSATDLSDRPRTEEAAAADAPHRLSDTGRAQTEPRQSLPASELWNRSGVTIRRNRPSQPDSPAQSPSLRPSALATTSSAIPQPSARTVPQEQSNDTSKEVTQVTTSFEEPDVACYRCQRKSIQYEVYKHCSPCDVDLCLRCYRSGRGCNHWFGFGHGAMARFDASHPRTRASQQIELPHLLVGRQYQKPSADSVKPKQGDSAVTTTSDPVSRLQEGHFCDRCGTFANSCFWTCDYCNEGEWGFCNACVATHHCCTHPLLPIAHKNFAPGLPFQMQPVDAFANHLSPTPSHSAPSSANSIGDRSFGPQPDYVQLSITTHCDICTQPIQPSLSRYHCPSHPSPSPQESNSVGDYDICTSCYHNLVKIGRMRRDDGPAGWRKCPNGHRMIITRFEADADGGQRRVVVSDLVGGVKMTDANIQEWNENMAAANKDIGGLGPGGQMRLNRGRWTWYDPAEAEAANTATSDGSPHHSRKKSRQAAIMPGSPALSATTPATKTTRNKPNIKFPPNGGFGKTCVGLWSYYPEEGEDGLGELMFPKGADVGEVEEVNEEWSEGVYAGAIGVFPITYTRDIEP